MKYAIGLALGFMTGIVVAALFFLYNPLTAARPLAPLAVTENDKIILTFSAVADDAIVYTNDGESRITPTPTRVLQLWEPAIRNTDLSVTLLEDIRGIPAGIGIKFASQSEDTSLFNGKAIVNSLWHVYLPERGSFVVGQNENRFDYLRQIVAPAHWSSGKSWRGKWHGPLTAGPGPLGTAEVAGGSGEFAGLDTEAVESLSARAYSAISGPVAADGQLAIDLPRTATVDLTGGP